MTRRAMFLVGLFASGASCAIGQSARVEAQPVRDQPTSQSGRVPALETTGSAAQTNRANLRAGPSPRAQPSPWPAAPRFEQVDEGFDDAGGQSLKVQPLDLRRPIGFEHVYRVSTGPRRGGTPDLAGPTELFARKSGGITAVFPRSEYVATEEGDVYAKIPAGTVFHVGSVRPEALGRFEPSNSAPSPLSASTRAPVPGALGAEDPNPPAASALLRAVAARRSEMSPMQPLAWLEGSLRQQRLADLLKTAPASTAPVTKSHPHEAPSPAPDSPRP